MKLSIIIVHHGPTAALQRCLHTLTAPGREIIVVHNGGDPPPEPQPPAAYTIIPNPGDLQTLLAEAAAHPEFTVLSCRQTNSQGRPAKTFDSFPNPATIFGLTRALARLFASNKNPNPRSDWEGIVNCDWVSGSVLMVSAADLKTVGGWSEDFWLYLEDVDFCKRIRNQGMRVGCTAAVTLIHDHAPMKTPRRSAAQRPPSPATPAHARLTPKSAHAIGCVP
jgi:GT2 family glycosyltransferase